MARSDKEKIEFVVNSFQEGKSYREIQALLKEKFGSGMSNATIKKIQKEQSIYYVKDNEITRLKQELELFKNLYFELLEKTNKK